MADNKREYRHLFASKDRNGTITGGVEIYLKKIFDRQTKAPMDAVATYRNVKTQSGRDTVVCNVEGSLQVTRSLKSSLKYLFDVDIDEGEFVPVRVGLWGAMGASLAKFSLAENDDYLFFFSNAKCTTFTRKNGKTGCEIEFTAYDFRPLRRAPDDAVRSVAVEAGAVNNGASAPAKTPKAVDNAGDSTVSDTMFDDFAAIDDSGDLPF